MPVRESERPEYGPRVTAKQPTPRLHDCNVAKAADSVRPVKGLLIDGPAAGSVIETGDPPLRRGIIVIGPAGFGEDAYRYYLSSVDASGASYRCGGKVAWPPEAGLGMIGRLADQRERVADQTAPPARLNGD